MTRAETKEHTERPHPREVKHADESDWAQVLYDAADGNVDGLMEMWQEHMTPRPAPAPSVEPELRAKTANLERERIGDQLKQIETKVSAEPFSASHTSNWVARAGGLPHYIQHIAHDLMDQRGMSESQAIQMAIGICQRWARGGANVSADTRAKAAAAIAQWERMKAGKALGDMPTIHDFDAMVSGEETNNLLDLFESMYASRIPTEPGANLGGANITTETASTDHEVKGRLDRIEELLEKSMHQAATRPRTAGDDFRRQSEQAVLDLQLDGVSRLRKTPQVDSKAQAAEADRLRRETRDEWLNIYLRR